MIATLAIFIAVLALLILVHESGHFFFAKRAGVAVEEFGFGFPPRAVSFKKGGTVYSLNWIPLGGFVKIKGEAGEHARDKDSFSAAPARLRAAIIVAGVSMNLLLAWVLLSAGLMVGLPTSLDGPTPPGARVSGRAVRVVAVLPDSPAQKAGLDAGDIIVELDGREAGELSAVRDYLVGRVNQAVAVRLRRGAKELAVVATPVILSQTGRAGLGVGLAEIGFVSYPWYLAPLAGGREVASLTGNIVLGFGEVIRDAVMGRGVSVDLSGPVGIAVITGEAARLGFVHLLQFVALLSVNLAVINILPIPALDGGRLLFIVIEKIRRRPLSERLEGAIHRVGFVLLLLLAFLVTIRDVSRFGSRVIGALKSLLWP